MFVPSPKSTLLAMLTASGIGTVTADQKYRAYGIQRDTGTVSTDHQFTGQKQDGTGLMYYGARFYDPSIGTFISADTIVPEPGLVSDYNRYAYARGNALRFVDPTGHYTEDELKEHFNCGDNWNCVLAYFQEGGSYAGLWGWLQILLAAQDGDVVQSTLMMQQDNGMMQNASLQGTFGREDGHIVIRNGKSVGLDGSSSNWSGSITEFSFSQFANAGGGSTEVLNFGTYQMQGKSGFMQVMRDSRTCGVGQDCTAIVLDTVSVAAGVGSFACGPLAPGCVAVASNISGIATGIGLVRTGISVHQGSTSLGSAAVSVGLAAPSLPHVGNPKVAIATGVIQLVIDLVNSVSQ